MNTYLNDETNKAFNYADIETTALVVLLVALFMIGIALF